MVGVSAQGERAPEKTARETLRRNGHESFHL